MYYVYPTLHRAMFWSKAYTTITYSLGVHNSLTLEIIVYYPYPEKYVIVKHAALSNLELAQKSRT
jgi:hypothetical protein